MNLNELSKEELIEQFYKKEEQLILAKEELRKIKKQKKYGLVWENHEEPNLNKNAIPLLTERTDLSLIKDEKNLNHMLIEGDNYQALRSLQFTHKEKIDVIYIDPPYNTGNKDFVYNDSFVDSEDSFRHSKWLSFMEKRLKLAQNLLSDDGVIFISIDDNEQAQLKLLCDEIFGINNVENFIWKKTQDNEGVLKMTNRFRIEHEYIIVCYKNKSSIKMNKTFEFSKLKNEYGNVDNDYRGNWISAELCKGEEKSNPNGKNYYTFKTPSGKEFTRQWHYSLEDLNLLINDNRVYFGKNGDSVPRLKKFVNEKRAKVPTSIISEKGTAKSSQKDLTEILGSKKFDYPKPKELIIFLFNLIQNKNAIVLDFFAGSGTTGQAVMELNKEDGGNRQFILCTNNEVSTDKEIDYLIENKYISSKKDYKNFKETEEYQQFINSEDYQLLGIARQVTRERLIRVINGYTKHNGENVDGLEGNNLHYYQTNEFANIKNKLSDYEIYELKENIVDLLKIKHQTFNYLIDDSYFIYTNNEEIICLIKSEYDLDDYLDVLKDFNLPLTVYLFSWSKEEHEELSNRINSLKDNVLVIEMPKKIMEIYKERKVKSY